MSGQGFSGDRREISVGDPGAFANEMAKLVNTKEYRSVWINVARYSMEGCLTRHFWGVYNTEMSFCE